MMEMNRRKWIIEWKSRHHLQAINDVHVRHGWNVIKKTPNHHLKQSPVFASDSFTFKRGRKYIFWNVFAIPRVQIWNYSPCNTSCLLSRLSLGTGTHVFFRWFSVQLVLSSWHKSTLRQTADQYIRGDQSKIQVYCAHFGDSERNSDISGHISDCSSFWPSLLPGLASELHPPTSIPRPPSCLLVATLCCNVLLNIPHDVVNDKQAVLLACVSLSVSHWWHHQV